MNYKTFTRIISFLTSILFCITLYFILRGEVSPSLKTRIGNFSNIAYAEAQNVKISANAPIKKKIVFFIDDIEHAIMLHAKSSNLYISKKNNEKNMTEHIASPKLILENNATLKKTTIKNTNLVAKKAIFNISNQSIDLHDTHIKSTLVFDDDEIPIDLYSSSCILTQAEKPYLKAKKNRLVTQGLTISGQELIYDKHLLHMNRDIQIELVHEDKGIHTLRASSLIFDPSKKIIDVFSNDHHPIIIEQKRDQTQIMAKNLQIDFSNGIKQACIKSDATVNCSSKLFNEKPIKDYFTHGSSTSKHSRS